MPDELPKQVNIPAPQPIVPFPGLPPTDCMGECCDQHYTIRSATALVKAGRTLERQALKVSLTKLQAIAKKDGREETVTVMTDLLAKLASGELTQGVKP
jgi:hypothetical protein